MSSEIFQKRLLSALEGLNGVLCIADDLNLYGIGNTTADALHSHDANLTALLNRCKKLGIKLSLPKCEFRKAEIPFHGHLFTAGGLKPDPSKVEAILKLQQPMSVEEVQGITGTVNYLSQFLPKIADVMEPIRKLTGKNVLWVWGEQQYKALDELKDFITSAPVLGYYFPKDELMIQYKASEKGLGAMLLQSGHLLAYSSRAFTDTETRYAQMEKETLTVVFSPNKFLQYTVGKKL